MESTDTGNRDTPVTGEAPGESRLLTERRVVTVALVICGMGALLAFAYLAKAVVVPILLAWVLSMALKPPLRWLERLHLRTALAAAIVVTSFVVIGGYGMVRLGRPAVAWMSSAPEELPRLKEKFRKVLQPAAQLTEAASTVGDLASGTDVDDPEPVSVKDNHVVSTVFSWTGSVLTSTGETVVLLFLFLASGDMFLQKLVRLSPRLRDKKRAVEISREIQLSVSNYLFSVGMINVGFGALMGAVLYLLGMPNAAMWGAVAALLNFIPYIGPIVGMVTMGLAGLMVFETLEMGLVPVGVYTGLHLIEANLVTPLVLGYRFSLNPVVIFVAVIFCLWLWGPIGALLAVPLLMTAKVMGDRIPALNALGEILAGQSGTGGAASTEGTVVPLRGATPRPDPALSLTSDPQ